MSLQQAKNNGFNLAWKNTNKNTTDSQDGFFEMRAWQKRAFQFLKEKKYMILNAPMGSGKSWLMCMLGAFKLKQDQSLRCIITVPQTVIASGFVNEKFIMPDGEKVHWQIMHNLCSDTPDMGTINYFIKWFEQLSKEFVDRILICTHATLVATYKRLKAENKLHILNNLLLWIDEAHHVKNVLAYDLDGVVINNGLGEVVNYFLNYALNIQLGLTTASFFRGDRASLLTDSMEEQFERFNLPYDEYLGSMKHLKSFSFNFLLSGHDYIQGLHLLLDEHKGKDIIYIPHPISRYSTGDKHQEVNNIIGIYGNEFKTSQSGVTVVRGEKRDRRILDLVNETQRKQKKNFLNSPNLKKNRDALDAIITLGMFKEGADWVYADRSIIVGPRDSLVDVFQILGRPFRDVPGKNHVEVVQILPFSLDQVNEQKFAENLNSYLKAIYASLLLENILNPVKIKAISNIEKKNFQESNNDDYDHKTDWLAAELPDEIKQSALMEEAVSNLLDIRYSNKNAADDTSTLYDEFQKVMPKILINHGISNHHEEVAKQIWSTFTRRTMQMQGIDVENIDFNIIQKMNPLGFLNRYTSGTCGLNTFEKLREAINASRPEWMLFQEARKFVHALKLSGETEWRKYIAGKMKHLPELPVNIPKAPWTVYDEWQNWGDFLGTGVIAPRLKKYRSYEEAKKFVHTLELTRKDDWFLYLKKKIKGKAPLPNDIPSSPDKTYKRACYNSEWAGWRDFLGYIKIAPQEKSDIWMSYEEAKEFAQSLNLKKVSEWRKYIKGEFPKLPYIPFNFPRTPEDVYASVWEGWTFFLGSKVTKYHSNREFLSFREARKFVKKLGLRTQKNWNDYCSGKFPFLPKKPLNIPSNPSKKYKEEGWKGYRNWLVEEE